LVSPEVVAEMVCLNIDGHMTIRKLRKHFEIAYGMKFSHAFVNSCLKRTAYVLLPIFLEVIHALKIEI
jgi:hypothetical protein